MKKNTRIWNNILKYAIVITIAIALSAINNNAKADECYDATKLLEANLEKYLKKNNISIKAIKKAVKKLSNYSKGIKKDNDFIETFMKDKNITKKEAQKMAKMGYQIRNQMDAGSEIQDELRKGQRRFEKLTNYFDDMTDKCKDK